MAYLITNDDGIGAPGLNLLRDLVKGKGPTVVVAPHTEQSGVGHRVTDRTPVVVRHVGDNEHEVEGTPADCARIGVKYLANTSSWVLSGINAGSNLGTDIYMSGTAAAAREAAFLGVRSIALSQYTRTARVDINWEKTRDWAAGVLEFLFERPLPPRAFWNVNFPDPDSTAADPQIVICPIDPGHHLVDYELTDAGYMHRGIYQKRHREPGCDVDVCFSGNIAVTLVTHG
jgi:5'-nucleotidase